jgi:hypothetical protein
MTTKPFRTVDLDKLSQYYVFSENVIQKTLSIAGEQEVSPEVLPDSLVPTNSLLYLCVSYCIMYDKLLEYELVAHPKPNKTIH